MDFEYCESCGKRVSKADIESGHGGYVGVHYYCEDCAPPEAVPAPATRVTGRRSRASSSRPSRARAASRIGYDELDDYYEDDYDDAPRSSRRSSRPRSSSGSRAGRGRRTAAAPAPSRRGKPAKRTKKSNAPLVLGGAAAAVVLAVVIAAAAGAFSSKPAPTPTPLPTVSHALSAYQAKLAEARRIRDEAIRLYEKGKNSSDPARGIKKALVKLDQAIEILYSIQDEYENAGRECPSDVDKLLTDLNSLKKGWRKSMPIDVWH